MSTLASSVRVSPGKALPVFAALTAKADESVRRQIAKYTTIVAAIVGLLFIFLGHFLLQIFHITLPALQIGGGIILLLFALEMIMGKEKGAPGAEEKPSLDIAISPLALPLMATPQGIVTLIMLAAADPSFKNDAIIAACLAAILAFNLLCLLSAGKIVEKIGPALPVISKIMGLLLTALAVQLMIVGFQELGVIPNT